MREASREPAGRCLHQPSLISNLAPHVAGGVQIPHIIAQFALVFSHLWHTGLGLGLGLGFRGVVRVGVRVKVVVGVGVRVRGEGWG